MNIINNQIKQIENLVNEFSDFARMPKPLLKKNNISQIILNNIKLLSKVDKDTNINFLNQYKKEIIFDFDLEQINRAIFNLIKNAIESIKEKREKIVDFKGIINVEIESINEYINVYIKDNGTGFSNDKSNDLIKPYYTTKKNGSGLGLSIVNKIIADHNGKLYLSNMSEGAEVKLQFNKYVN